MVAGAGVVSVESVSVGGLWGGAESTYLPAMGVTGVVVRGWRWV